MKEETEPVPTTPEYPQELIESVISVIDKHLEERAKVLAIENEGRVTPDNDPTSQDLQKNKQQLESGDLTPLVDQPLLREEAERLQRKDEPDLDKAA